VEISPQRGAVDVRSNEPVRVRFDRPMDEATVTTRLHVSPAVPGSLHWVNEQEVTFEHSPFGPSSRYQVILDPGYRDARGISNSLRHRWSFTTETAPALTGASPGAGDRDVDPATYITLSFSREMDSASLRDSVSLSPGVPFDIHQDPTDPRRVVLAPRSLLDPGQTYGVSVTQDARDVDGNRLDVGRFVSFTTGSFRPLRHWVTFVAQQSLGESSDGVWIVNQDRFPRQLVAAPVSAFSWSSDGDRLLLRSPTGDWTDQALDGVAEPLAITGEWADYLAPGRGYVFLDRGSLLVLRPDGRVEPVATGVRSAAVVGGGSRLAFAAADPAVQGRGSEIWGYDPDLRTRYRLGSESGAVDGLAWSPDGQSLAYRVDAGDPARRQLRVRSLRDGGVVTVATGAVSAPVWQADSRHVFVTALVATRSGSVAKAFRFAIDDPSSKTFSAALGLPGGPDVAVEALSPSADGHQLAFISGAGGRPGVWLMNADGTGVTQLTRYDPVRFPYSCQSAGWTPN
jgi:dipeptidyl aminopeptidase/acylaminoacyl peptidase